LQQGPGMTDIVHLLQISWAVGDSVENLPLLIF
jgi:hypothetical protein